VRKGQVASGASVVLADRMDLSGHCAITNPGSYTVRFAGEALAIGQPVRGWNPGPFGEHEGNVSGFLEFFALTNRLSSNVIQIEVIAGSKQ
jgi:hypothetical protein